jgi:RimJ/RimL family protein N-acetyltransferase
MEDQPSTILTQDELILRPWRSNDAAALMAACGDPEIARWAGLPQPFLPADGDAFIESATARLGHDPAAERGLVTVGTEAGRGVGTRSLRLLAD